MTAWWSRPKRGTMTATRFVGSTSRESSRTTRSSRGEVVHQKIAEVVDQKLADNWKLSRRRRRSSAAVSRYTMKDAANKSGALSRATRQHTDSSASSSSRTLAHVRLLGHNRTGAKCIWIQSIHRPRDRTRSLLVKLMSMIRIAAGAMRMTDSGTSVMNNVVCVSIALVLFTAACSLRPCSRVL